MTKRIVLGSQSARRRECLEKMGIPHIVKIVEVDETPPRDINIFKIPMYLAEKKNKCIRQDCQVNDILICADTLVFLENKVLGKPSDSAEAISILRSLRGKMHKVVTGVAISDEIKMESFSVETLVYFSYIPDAFIEQYVDEYKPFDKAGAYGIQEFIGYAFINKIEGSYTNIVGLPTEEVFDCLQNWEGVNFLKKY